MSMTKQEIFDKVITHLRQQNAKSIDYVMIGPADKPKEQVMDPRCRYLSSDGKKCAVGCLIKSEEYNISLEDQISSNLFLIHSFKERIGIDNKNLIFQFQLIHDSRLVNNWEREFKYLAKRENLNYSPPV
jgi:hypothetical protein